MKTLGTKMEFLCYAKCTTCQKAKKWLDANGIEYTERPIKEKNPSIEELKAWHQMSGLSLKRPMLIGDDFVLAGFKEAEWEDKLK